MNLCSRCWMILALHMLMLFLHWLGTNITLTINLRNKNFDKTFTIALFKLWIKIEVNLKLLLIAWATFTACFNKYHVENSKFKVNYMVTLGNPDWGTLTRSPWLLVCCTRDPGEGRYGYKNIQKRLKFADSVIFYKTI